jgi:hypothetical protein
MTVYYDEEELQTRLSILDHRSLVLFGLFIAERLLPNYAVFSKEQSFGDVLAFRNALDLAWNWLNDRPPTDDAMELSIETCESLTPDTEEFSSLYVSAALDAANSTLNVLRLLKDSDSELAIENGMLSRDTVDLYVQEIDGILANSQDLEERIRLHPLMQNEISQQYDAIKTIEAGIAASEARRQWRAKERSNLDIA